MNNEMIPHPQPQHSFPAARFKLKQSISSLTGAVFNGERSVATIALLATLVAATIVLILWTSAQSYVPLYGNQEHYDKASILEILDKEQFPFHIDNDTGNILVPQNRLADARITLSARGIKAALPEGLSSLNGKVNMGTSQFMESMQYQHALEGELARTIITMEGIRNSRVHLAIPKQTLFIGRQDKKSAASVMVDLIPGYELKAPQVESIVSLITGSIPGLDPHHVSVVDQRGNLLSGELYDETPMGKQSDKKLAFKEKLERSIEQRAAVMLSPVLGENNFRIQVFSEVDFNVVEETTEAVDPDSVMRTETVKSDTMQDQFAMGIPGSLANQPPTTNEKKEADDKKRLSERSESTRQYENGRSVKHTRYEVGRLTSMSLSVLVNSAAAAPQGWSHERLQQLGEMVKAATGFQAERGDQFNITSFNFVTAQQLGAEQGLEWWQLPETMEYSRYIAGALTALLLILFGVRPLVNHLIRDKKTTEEILQEPIAEAQPNVVESKMNRDDGSAQSMADALIDDVMASASGQPMPETQIVPENTVITTPHQSNQEMVAGISLPQVGSQLQEQIAHMQLLTVKEPDRVAAVIKQWTQQGAHFDTSYL